MQNCLDLINLDDYAKLISSLFADVVSVAVYQANGELVWSHGDAAHKVLSSIDGGRIDRKDKESGLVRQVVMEGAGIHRRYPVTTVNDEPVGWLSVLFSGNADVSQADVSHEKMEYVLGLLGKILTTEYRLNDELGFMAVELAARYEELNLVFATDDQVDDFAKGKDAMQNLVGNCTEFLGVGMTVLFLPNKNIKLISVNSLEHLGDASAISHDLQETLLSIIGKNGSFVLNSEDDADYKLVCRDHPLKVLASSVTTGEGSVVGVLAVVNNSDALDFSNNDRNLLEVMAKKTAKIVQASYDMLTGLINTHGFEWCIEQALLSARSSCKHHCLLNIDLDRLQVVNDICGRQAGDVVIKSVAGIIKSQVRDGDAVARLGGDEFGILLENCSLEKAEVIAKAIAEKVRSMDFVWDDVSHELTVTIGVVPLTGKTDSIASALSMVEVAQKEAKDKGRNRIQVFQLDDRALTRRREEMHWLGRIQRALREHQFRLFAQVIQPLAPDNLEFHCEVLIRLQDDDGKILPPGMFLPAAENYFLMPQLDRWVITETLSKLAEAWPFLSQLEGHVAINLSGQSLCNDAFQQFVLDELDKTIVPAEWICFEITESAAVENLDYAKQFIREVRGKGCKIALDDFGTGLSSFSYLKEFDLDYLKIDGSFVKEIAVDPVSEAMVSSINQVGQVMGLETIAEYVEDDAIFNKLRKIGVNFGQGYGIGRPLPIEDIFVGYHSHASEQA